MDDGPMPDVEIFRAKVRTLLESIGATEVDIHLGTEVAQVFFWLEGKYHWTRPLAVAGGGGPQCTQILREVQSFVVERGGAPGGVEANKKPRHKPKLRVCTEHKDDHTTVIFDAKGPLGTDCPLCTYSQWWRDQSRAMARVWALLNSDPLRGDPLVAGASLSDRAEIAFAILDEACEDNSIDGSCAKPADYRADQKQLRHRAGLPPVDIDP